MIKTITNDQTSEADAAKELESLILKEHEDMKRAGNVDISIIPSVQCFGQNPRDVDLVFLMFDKRDEKKLLQSTKHNRKIRSLCVTIEIKDHSGDAVKFEGNSCKVKYKDDWHDATYQSEKQKYSLHKYIGKSDAVKAPWIVNIIWLRNVLKSNDPKITNNIFYSDSSWSDFIDLIAQNYSRNDDELIKSFHNANNFKIYHDLLTKEITISKLDRKKIENIRKDYTDREQTNYYEKMGEQLLLFRGRGGTGKTVRLLQLAYYLYHKKCERVLILTYNNALVSDLQRLLTLMKIKNGIADRGIDIKTIHSFMLHWFKAVNLDTGDFISKYHDLEKEFLNYLNEDALTKEDVKAAIQKNTTNLSWDYIMIDESQDWPEVEKKILYKIYEPNKFVIADGVDQLVRAVKAINWRDNVNKANSQVVSLTKSLRLKAKITKFVKHFAEAIDYEQWDLLPLPDNYGGKVIVLEGDAGLIKENFDKHILDLIKHGNQNFDMLFCVPPSWVVEAKEKNKKGETVSTRYSRISKILTSWGYSVWDGVDLDVRRNFSPESIEQLRVVQYESCRGLEGWTVVNLAFDEFHDFKRNPKNMSKSDMDLSKRSNDGTLNYLVTDDEILKNHANKWAMIPLTRSIDTLIIHINSSESFIGNILKEIHELHPEEIEWISSN